MRTAAKSKCPTAILLSGYVAGTLPESEADRLATHIEECPRCQDRIDGMVVDDDSLLAALRRRGNGGKQPADTQLAKLIAVAGKLDSSKKPHSTKRAAESRSQSVDLGTFVDCLRNSEIFSAEEIDEWQATIRPEDSTVFARELVARKKLTSFQAGILLRGRWKGLVLGNYVVLEKLGKGGMGHVYKARHRKMGRVVCLKVLHATGERKPELVERFRREAQAVAALSHPNIVVAHDADEALGLHFLVMEFISGSDLARHVAQHGPLPAHEAAAGVLQVAQALDYAHQMGIVHRDIKPHNLLLDDSGTIKILDMGLARFDSFLTESADGLTNNASMTNTGVVIGTVDYMSPEQALNSRLANNRSDIYSLGCTLYFLLTGRPLYDGETVMEKLVAHREHEVPSLSGINAAFPPGLDAIFHRMVAKDPEQRYETMGELADDLEAFLDGKSPAALSLLPQSKPTRELMRSRNRVGSIVTIAVAVVALAIWWFWPPQATPTKDGSHEPLADTEPAVPERPDPAPLKFPGRHQSVLANNGPGRALVVLPKDYFYEDHYTEASKALKKRGTDIVIASSQLGHANPKHNRIPPVPIDVTLDQVVADDFDMVVFVGGSSHEFTRKNKWMHEQTRALIEASLDDRRVFAGIGDGYQPVREAIGELGCAKKCGYQKRRGMHVGFPGEHRVRWVEAFDTWQARELVSLAFDDLLAEEGKSNSRR